MKLALIIFFSVLAIVLGFSASSLQKELLSARESNAFYEERNDDLQRELTRMNRAYNEKERFLNGIEQSIAEFKSKVELETLERNIPKKIWNEIKPIIDRLKTFQETRENDSLPGKQKHEEDY
jgi:hypothetical protein